MSWSGKRGSNSRPSAWKADALPTELLPQISGGGRWTRTTEPEGADLQSAAIAAMRSPQVSRNSFRRLEPKEGFEPTTPRLQITCSGQLSYIGSFPSPSKGLQRYALFLILQNFSKKIRISCCENSLLPGKNPSFRRQGWTPGEGLRN